MRWGLIIGIVMLCCGRAFAGFESPATGSIKSGLGLIRGWVCDAQQVTYRIDGGEERQLVYGADRGDTLGVCGDRDNGFEKLVNWNDVGGGRHTIRVFVDGAPLGEAIFQVVTLGLGNYPLGLSGTYQLPGFPTAEQGAEITWSERDQNFMLSDVYQLDTDGSLTGYWAAEYERFELCAGELGRGVPERSAYQETFYIEQSGDAVSVYSIGDEDGEEVRTLDYTSRVAGGVMPHPVPLMSPGVIDWKGLTIFLDGSTAHYYRTITGTDYGDTWCLYAINGEWTKVE